MKLSLLRHAKSTWDDPVERDFDRPLNGRGRRAATRIGRYLAEEKLFFDLVLASPALRVRQTLEGVEDGLSRRLQPRFDRRIYMASALTLLELVQELGGTAGHVLLTGHNPGLEDLVLNCADPSPLREQAAEKYPTATLATLEWPGTAAPGITEGGATLTRFIRPRDLDPSLGPDD